jgi:uncharacterized membrane protein
MKLISFSALIERLKNLNRYDITILLICMSLFCFGISVTRFFKTETRDFLFLNWNLFLAFLPWLFSSIIIVKKLNQKFYLIILIISWIIFFPNSPYILTDLFHLNKYGSAPIWFDLVVILSFAWTGLIYGFISLMDMELLLKKYLTEKFVNISTIILLFISAFGIYLGRYLRWNSWDVFRDPVGLSGDILDRFVNPYNHPRTWQMTLLMGVLLNMMYFSIKLLKDKKNNI